MGLESVDPLEGSGVAGAGTAAMIEAVLRGVVQVRSRKNWRRGTGAGFLWSPDGSV